MPSGGPAAALAVSQSVSVFRVSHDLKIFGQTFCKKFAAGGSFSVFRSDADFDGETWPSDAGAGDSTTWIFDEATGLLIQKLDAEYKGATYAYSAEGKLLTRTWARTDQGQALTTTYGYDPATGEMILTDYSDSTPDIAFEYDRLGRQMSVTDGSGARTFTYNDYLQPESEAITGTVQAVITRAYDAMGRNAGFSTGADYALAYGYDEYGRFETVQYAVDGVAGSASYGYLANSGLLESVTMIEDGADTAVTATYGYEPHRNVKTLVTNQYGAETVSEYGYGYDALGRRTSVTNSGTAFDEPAFNIYGYNSRNELTASNRYLGNSIFDTASQVNDETRAYDYDPIGNRINAQQDYDISSSAPITSTYVTNSLNQYESVMAGGSTISLDYDDDGNLIHKDGVEYVFNCENRLVEVSPLAPVIGDTKVAFAYDYMGRRYLEQSYVYSAGEWSLVSTSTSIWEGWNRIQETTVLASDDSEEKTSWIWGLDLSQSLQGAGGVGGLIAVVDDDSEMDFFLYDANGNVGQLVNALTGDINAAYEYDPFGRLINAQGSKANSNPYRFSTKPMDQQTGLYYYGYRYLDVDLGRWVSRDHLGEFGGTNLYAYVVNRPSDLIDAFGLFSANIGFPNMDGESTITIKPGRYLKDRCIKVYVDNVLKWAANEPDWYRWRDTNLGSITIPFDYKWLNRYDAGEIKIRTSNAEYKKQYKPSSETWSQKANKFNFGLFEGLGIHSVHATAVGIYIWYTGYGDSRISFPDKIAVWDTTIGISARWEFNREAGSGFGELSSPESGFGKTEAVSVNRHWVERVYEMDKQRSPFQRSHQFGGGEKKMFITEARLEYEDAADKWFILDSVVPGIQSSPYKSFDRELRVKQDFQS
ncbi:RHS repeat-associated core domain-containing protein [Desulfatibacillum alkenivorans DSM 16219]|uniref:RHS repeat-associated core domain-containing protein n=1 Tax=Desulfatibacillum alkenivorans DSM 16219 TaxID=1121393 RepID=A0A1M6ZCI9_9BACT|nr:RHS repeat-associated core domain-containing protein [Desulfatibacillum alkenivorans]SHL28202.1 RHS repeat-associated core domain-containing protein [Desulfatibacillum alkenivorans DSM 16219]